MSLPTGTVLFSRLAVSSFSAAVSSSAGAPDAFNHVGIVCPGNTVAESTPDTGVILTPAHLFFRKSAAVLCAAIKDKELSLLAARHAMRRVGTSYNHSFHPKGSGLYCSQLVTTSFIRRDDTPYFDLYPMNFRLADGSVIPYWRQYYAQRGLCIPEGLPGSHPQQLFRQQDKFKIFWNTQTIVKPHLFSGAAR